MSLEMNSLVVAGKRKTSVAKAKIIPGSGKVIFNKRPLEFLTEFHQLEINEPLVIAREILGNLNFDISINVKSGGISSQVQAARLAIARALVQITKDEKLKSAFLAYDRNLLIADTRRKEARKPGDSKARAMRQTSFR